MPLQPDARLGPYVIVAPIGAGGMGEVYRARDPRLGREVAIKTLAGRLVDDRSALDRFRREAKAVAALSHPNILDIFDVGADQGIEYVVTELLHGETLRARFARGPLPWGKATEIAVALAEGLAAAHAQGIVHRDLKPENVFITTEGRIKILDFGLARHVPPAHDGGLTDASTASHETDSGTLMGTVGYMAPEHVRGTRADHRSDLFALGVILYEALSGRPPFRRATNAQTMAAILDHDPPPLHQFAPMPSALERVVRRCLEKEPSERFQSASDLAFDLRTVSREPPIPKRGRSGTLWLAVASALALGAIGAGATVWFRNRPAPAERGTIASSQVKSLAVLPFQNLSPDPENAFFADGITEDILAQVANIRDIKVTARTSVMRYRGTQKPVREIAAELGVGTVLEGSVRRAGNKVRIVSQLIDATTDVHLWAATYDRELDDIFAIQSDVAQQIAAALKAQLTATEKQRLELRPTASVDAYDRYLKGRELYYRYDKESNEQAIEHFQEALRLDPRFALAYAGLADGYAQRSLRFGFADTWVDSSIEGSRKALAIDPQLAEAHKALALGSFTKGRLREALAANLRAVDLKPSFGIAVSNLAFVLLALGRFDEALTSFQRSIAIDPLNTTLSSWHEGIGMAWAGMGDDARAEAAFRGASLTRSERPGLYQTLITFDLNRGRKKEALERTRSLVVAASDEPFLTFTAGSAELAVGDLERARALYERTLKAVPGQRRELLQEGGVETHLAFVYLRAGRRKEADQLLDASLEVDHRHLAAGNEHWSVPFDLACVHALRGNKGEALLWLDKAVDAGWRGWPQAKWDPLLDSLRGEPRFRALMARIDSMVAEMRRKAISGSNI